MVIPSGQTLETEEKWLKSVIEAPDKELIRRFLDSCLYGATYPWSEQGSDVRNPRLVDHLLDQKIVIERSPPKAVALRRLIGSNSIMTIGAAMGYALAPHTEPLLLLITVPTGIAVIGSAAGVATGLQNGLHEAVKKWIFNLQTKPKKRKVKKRKAKR